MQGNRFTGPIPSAIAKLEFLSYLDLSGNMLNGSIPMGMAQLNRLMTLDLSHNQFTGPIPGSVIASMKNLQIYLNFSYNLFSGLIPDELGMLEMIQAIDISNNNLSGKIPEMLRGCRNLFSIDLSGNKLTGPLPSKIFDQVYWLTSLNLSRNLLDGGLPENLADLKHLNSLDLSQNKLQGMIPESYANISSLKQLNLSFNQLQGHVPETGVFKSVSASSFEGNPFLCGIRFLTPCSTKNTRSTHRLSKKTILILAALGSVSLFLILVLAIAVFKQYAKKKSPTQVENPEPEYAVAMTLERFGEVDLEHATDFFSEDNIIGISILSTVYKGILGNGQIIAVKKLNLHQFPEETDKCFYREIKTLSQLRHKNLVKVIGYAWKSGKLKALVLEYMENGNLESIIHDNCANHPRFSALSERINILVSMASALVYLHSGYDSPIIHCDLKPSNVLLDGNFEAHVSDFGTAQILGVHLEEGSSSISSSAAFQGTIGYMAPGKFKLLSLHDEVY